MMDDILAQGNISESNLRLLVEKIYISEHDGKLDVDIHLKAPFRTHVDFYEKGEVVESGASLLYDFDRLGSFFEGDSWEDDRQEANT